MSTHWIYTLHLSIIIQPNIHHTPYVPSSLYPTLVSLPAMRKNGICPPATSSRVDREHGHWPRPLSPLGVTSQGHRSAKHVPFEIWIRIYLCLARTYPRMESWIGSGECGQLPYGFRLQSFSAAVFTISSVGLSVIYASTAMYGLLSLPDERCLPSAVHCPRPPLASQRVFSWLEENGRVGVQVVSTNWR